MKIEAVGIIGASTTGSSLAELFVLGGFQVRIYDNFKDSLNLAMAKIKWSLKKAGKEELLANIEPIQEYAKFNGADIVIETVSKTIEERTLLFNKISKELTPSCIIAVFGNAGGLKETLANIVCLKPENTLSINWLKPVRHNNLAEIIKTEKTPDEVIEAVDKMLSKLGKSSVIVADNPGQIAERIARVYSLAAFKTLYAGKGFPFEIDAAFKEISGAKFGPFEYLDYIGLDHDYNSCVKIWEALGKPERLKPSDLEQRLVQYGQLGRKSTIGIYIYDDGEIAGENPILPNIVKYLGLRTVSKEEIFGEILRPVLEECKILASEIMVGEYDIEKTIKAAFGWPKGPFAYLREKPELLEVKKTSEFDRLENF
ncbi:MAG: 3-hydroxyacyl-CoA dehydrogenase family protein [Elusimicrobia bacterium]|nr:3-hydroxyacyl-CoA dehydrogenase family protein [Elusimicrobiota bacterium]